MSSGSVLPLRRQRSDDPEEDSDQEDGGSSVRSQGSKRARLDHEVSDDENEGESPPSDGPLLPDNFRRSPAGKGHPARESAHLSNPQAHHPGSIVRVTLTNFVTYTKAEFHPGPNLNMIIGPNGTGKSTLVCAICLGLGWNTSHLGRAKDIGEFVKHGADKAEIEIELAQDPSRHRRNPVITTRINKDGGKTSFLINGKSETKKSVQELARSFSIQVDNLCQFLPQDRVAEFAALSPVELLVQTQRAAAPDQMHQWHDQLKAMRKEEKQRQTEQQSLMENLKSLEDRQKSQEGDVNRMRERGQLLERIATLEKLRPFAEYVVVKQRHTEAKERRKVAAKELSRLERQMGPNLQAVKDKEHYLERIEKAVGHRRRIVERSENDVATKLQKHEDLEHGIQGCVQEIEVERNSSKQSKQAIPRHQQEIQRVQRAMESPPAEFDPAEMNELIRQKKSQSRIAENSSRELVEQVNSLAEQGNQRRRLIQELEQQKETLHSQAGRQANKLESISKDTAKAWKWIQENRDRFTGEVYGPPMIECSVRNPRHADAVESIIPPSEFMAFTVTCQQDFKMLQQQLYGTMKLTEIYLRSSLQPLSSYRAPMSNERLRQLGLESWVLDLLDGPEAVLAMLCDNRSIHQTGFTSREVSTDEFEALKQSAISSWVTSTQTYVINRRREYGDKAVSTRVRALKKARILTDAPVDSQAEEGLNRRIEEAERETSDFKEQIEELKDRHRTNREEIKRLAGEVETITAEKGQRQKQLAEFNALPTKLDGARKKLDDAMKQVADSRERVLAIVEKGDRLCMEKGQLTVDYARAIEVLRGLHVQLFEAEILMLEAKSDLEQLRARHEQETNLLEQHRKEVVELQKVQDEALARGKAVQEQCRRIGEDLTADETEGHEQISGWEPEQLETEIQSVQAQLEMLHGGNEGVIREFEHRARKIEEKRAKLAELEAALEGLAAEISHVREQWEPQLDQLVGQISEAFAENFSRIQCAGEVAVHKDEDFDQWAIQIKVKFREQEQLSILDSHRQSGGERAVSTIFYLMALQSLARAPFRVVDEINQGMDPRNERLVHSRMVDIACAEHTSQYFLITPKLLNGLRYHPNMKVHCIASGEYMPADHRQLDFGALARKALEIRTAAAA